MRHRNDRGTLVRRKKDTRERQERDIRDIKKPHRGIVTPGLCDLDNEQKLEKFFFFLSSSISLKPRASFLL